MLAQSQVVALLTPDLQLAAEMVEPLPYSYSLVVTCMQYAACGLTHRLIYGVRKRLHCYFITQIIDKWCRLDVGSTQVGCSALWQLSMIRVLLWPRGRCGGHQCWSHPSPVHSLGDDLGGQKVVHMLAQVAQSLFSSCRDISTRDLQVCRSIERGNLESDCECGVNGCGILNTRHVDSWWSPLFGLFDVHSLTGCWGCAVGLGVGCRAYLPQHTLVKCPIFWCRWHVWLNAVHCLQLPWWRLVPRSGHVWCVVGRSSPWRAFWIIEIDMEVHLATSACCLLAASWP